MLRLVLLLLIFGLSLPMHAATFKKPFILATIKPIQLISKAIAGDEADVELLLPALVSPHFYQLKPSDRYRMAEADLLIWLGPEMERFLIKPLAQLPQQQVLRLLDETAVYEVHEETGDEHGHHGVDPHIWLNPEQAIGIARRIAQRLSEQLPAKQQNFRQNLQSFEQQVRAVDKLLGLQFQQLKPRPYLVLHDAYQHFETHYGVNRAAALSISPDKKPGAKHLVAIRQMIEEGAITCVFREPQYQPAILNAILAGANIRTQLLDPMATEVPVSEQGYGVFLKQFGNDFLSCIQ